MFRTTLIMLCLLGTTALAETKLPAKAQDAIDPDCTAQKAAKGAAMKATVGVGNRCGAAETAKDVAGVDGKGKDLKKKVSN